jgi:hypothetical protein
MPLHWLTSQLSVTFTDYHTLSRTQSLCFTLGADCDIFFVKLSLRSDSAANSPKRLVSRTATQIPSYKPSIVRAALLPVARSVSQQLVSWGLCYVTVFTGVALETSALPCDVIEACCVAALGAVLLGTAQRKHRFPHRRAAPIRSRVVYRPLPSSALLRNPTMGWHVTLL